MREGASVSQETPQRTSDPGSSEPSTRSTEPAVLVVRAWREDPGEGGFRARVTTTPLAAGASEDTLVVASAEHTERLLHDWLRQFSDS